MKPYIHHVRRLYPCLVTVKYGAIKSLAGCPSQYEGHGNRFHMDYSSFYPTLPPHERPGSIILAMDDFNFKHLPLSTLSRKEIININVPPAHAIFFPNSCWRLSRMARNQKRLQTLELDNFEPPPDTELQQKANKPRTTKTATPLPGRKSTRILGGVPSVPPLDYDQSRTAPTEEPSVEPITAPAVTHAPSP